MWFVVSICIFNCLLLSVNGEVGEQQFSQLLDHNSPVKSYWNQRYFYNNEYWPGTNSCVFLTVGGEGAADINMMTYGMWTIWGKNHSCLLFMLEHRFYGKSHPTSDVSDQNLIKYMSSQQALADIAYFIDEINSAYNFAPTIKWFLFGGSYSGSLAAWARLKYPKQVYAAVSSSGPLQAIVDFSQYFDVAAKALDYYSPNCSGEITKATVGVQKIMDKNNLTLLNQYFKTCDGGFDPTKSDDRVYFFDQVVGNIAKQAVQYNKQLQSPSIDLVCSYMNNRSIADPVDRLSKYYKSINDGCIYANNDVQTAFFKKTNWNDQFNREDLRQWRFQLCNEFGFIQTSGKNTSLFSTAFPLSYYTKQCTDVFGPNYNAKQLQQSVDKTNAYYGGKNIMVTRVAFVTNLLDPWSPLSSINFPSKTSPLYKEYASHTYDMNEPRDDDPPSVTEARMKVGQNIDEWIKL